MRWKNSEIYIYWYFVKSNLPIVGFLTSANEDEDTAEEGETDADAESAVTAAAAAAFCCFA